MIVCDFQSGNCILIFMLICRVLFYRVGGGGGCMVDVLSVN